MDWLAFLAVQGTLKSLLQHHSSKVSIIQCSAFFIVQLSHPYMTTGKTKALTRWTFVGKVMPLLFNMLSRLVIAFLPRSNHLLIPWLQSQSEVILEPKKVKTVTVSVVSPSVCHEVMGPDAMELVFWMLSFKPAFLLSSFLFIKNLFSSSSFSAITVLSSAYLSLLIFLPAILIPASASSSPAFRMIYSAYKLINRLTVYSLEVLLPQFVTTSCSISDSNCCFLICIQVFQETGKVVWYSHLFKEFSTVCCDPHSQRLCVVKGYRVVNEAEVDVFLEFSCFFLWSNGCWQFGLWFHCLF